MTGRLASLVPAVRLARVTLLACALAAAGCSSPASPTFGTVSPAGLEGVWTLEILQRAGGPAIATPANATYTLTFSGNTVSARADCNTCVGSYTMVGDAVTITSTLACTRAICATAGFEVLYESLLGGESRVGVSGKTMVLNSARGQLRFMRFEARA